MCIMERKRIDYIDWLRIISALAVIGIHITMTQPNNYSVQEIGRDNYIILTCVYTLIQWAVPVFLMISGNLLLHSNKITFAKVKKVMVIHEKVYGNKKNYTKWNDGCRLI